MKITIPAFVPRGLATMDDPTTALPTEVRYGKEEHLRDAMATLWWLHGWTVQTEVKVPACGRIDVLARSANSAVIVELKKEIVTPTQARQAFQQAHSYLSFLSAAESGEDYARRPRFTALVTAGNLTWDVLAPADRAYLDVHSASFFEVVEQSHAAPAWYSNVTPEALSAAAHVARARREDLAALASASRAAEALSVLAAETTAMATGAA